MNVGELSYPADLRAPGKMRDRIICHERVDGALLTDLPDSLKPFVIISFGVGFMGVSNWGRLFGLAGGALAYSLSTAWASCVSDSLASP